MENKENEKKENENQESQKFIDDIKKQNEILKELAEKFKNLQVKEEEEEKK